MDRMIAYCGLDCRKCDAYIATINNNDELRKKTAERWSELNSIEILPEMINCEGCRMDGLKTAYCDELCLIKKCASEKGFCTCGDCKDLRSCDKVSMVIGNNEAALKNLTQTDD